MSTVQVSLAQRLREDVAELQKQRAEHLSQRDLIDESLTTARQLMTWDTPTVQTKPAKRKVKATVWKGKPTAAAASKDQGQAASDYDPKDVAARCLAVLQGSKEPLDEPALAIEMTKAGFKCFLPPDEMMALIHTAAITPLLREGKIKKVGGAGQRKYSAK